MTDWPSTRFEPSVIATAVVLSMLAAAALASAADHAVPLRHRPDRVTCGYHWFQSRALSSRKGVERGNTGPERALRKFLNGPDNDGLPRHGWRILVRRRNAVEFGRTHRGQVTVDEALVDRPYGDWWVEGYSGCEPERIVRGREVAPWSLRLRRHQHLRATQRVIHLEVWTGTCYPSDKKARHAARRFDHAEVRYTHRYVGLLVLLRPEPAPPKGDCAGVGLTFARDISLPKPLGHRALVDVRTVPSTLIARARSVR